MADRMMRLDPVVIVAAKRTPIGAFQGALSQQSAPRLGARAIRAVLPEGVAPDEVFMGNVLSAGLGQNPARQAALGAGLPQDVPCTTVAKVCGSAMLNSRTTCSPTASRMPMRAA